MSYGRMNTPISIVQEVVTKDTEGFATKTDNILVSVHAYWKGGTVLRNGSTVLPFQRRRICSGFAPSRAWP